MTQNAIFIEGTSSANFLEANFNENIDVVSLKKSLVKVVEKNSDQLHVLVAFSKRGFEKLATEGPNVLVDFETLNGVNSLNMPATQSDLFIWAHSHSKSIVFDFTQQVKELLQDFIEIHVEIEGFRYHDSRDLTGFVDGSANPKGDKRMEEILVANGAHKNGTFVLTQKWVHKLKAFHLESVHEQERIIGRTKEDSLELEGDAMPNNSHVSSTDLKVNGEAMKIYRRSFPFSNGEDKGLFFLGFGKNIQRFDVQLKSMLGLSEDGISDRLMDFSIPITGAYYFAPSQEELSKMLTPQ